MTTSGSTDFSVSEANIMRDAALLLGIIDSGGSLDPQEQADMRRMLNMMCKHWQTKADLWPTKDVTVTLTPGTQSYTVGVGADVSTPRPLRLLSWRRRDSNSNEVEGPKVSSRQEYMSLPQKSTQGPVNVVYYDPQLSNGVLYVWPTGNTNNATLICTFQRPLEDFDTTTDTPDFPQEWYLALVYNLAVNSAPMFGAVIPPDVREMAAIYLAELDGWDTEGAGFMIEPGRM